MKIIFLDIDGVLCTRRACAAIGQLGGMRYIDPIACGLVTQLIREFSAKIVIISTWRLAGKVAVVGQFRCAGHHEITNALHKEWRTDDFNDANPSRRGREIESWLTLHGDVERYVILDDIFDMLDHQKPFVVKTDADDGIGYRQFERAREILGA